MGCLKRVPRDVLGYVTAGRHEYTDIISPLRNKTSDGHVKIPERGEKKRGH